VEVLRKTTMIMFMCPLISKIAIAKAKLKASLAF